MKKFGLIGHPVGHSMSAVMHKAAFIKLKLPYTYDLFDVEPGKLEAFMNKANDFSGLNVTIPHKVEVMRYLDDFDNTAKMIGAVNTIRISGGRKVGYNTDGLGCLRAIEDEGVTVKGKKIFVLGAGGGSKAVAYQLSVEGASITVADISMEKAVGLADNLNKNAGLNVKVANAKEDSVRKALLESDILINATPVGMHPKESETPVGMKLLRKELVVMDLVYNPFETKLLADARRIGCKTVSGSGMLVHQGAEAFRIWLGVEPPVEVMKAAVLKHLK